MKQHGQHYVEIFCIKGGELFKTGQGAAGRTMRETRQLFATAKRYSVPDALATFLVDLHDQYGDTIDTVMIDGRGFRSLTGEKPPTRAEARRLDSEYWAQKKAQRGWSSK
jgi:hypothetical protein